MNLNNNIRDHLKWARENLRSAGRVTALHLRLRYIAAAIQHLQMAERGVEWMERDDG